MQKPHGHILTECEYDEANKNKIKIFNYFWYTENYEDKNINGDQNLAPKNSLSSRQPFVQSFDYSFLSSSVLC